MISAADRFMLRSSTMTRLIQSDHHLISLFEHDLFGKPVPTLPDHALQPGAYQHDVGRAGDQERNGERQSYPLAKGMQRRSHACDFPAILPAESRGVVFSGFRTREGPRDARKTDEKRQIFPSPTREGPEAGKAETPANTRR